MNGYFIDDKPKGILKIDVKNIEEFNQLITKAKKEANQLQKTINQLACFHLEITLDTSGNHLDISEEASSMLNSQEI